MLNSSRLKFRLFALLLFLLPLFAVRPAGALENVLAHGNQEIAAGREVADVVVTDGNLRIAGKVRGSVFVANGDALLEPGALVQGDLTVFGGKALISKGARIGGNLAVFAGQAHLEEGAVVAGSVEVKEQDPSLTSEKIALVSRYLLLPRIVPNPAFSLDQLGKLDFAPLHLRKTFDQKVAYLDLGRAAKLPLDFKEVEDAREVRAEGRGRVRIVMIRFTGPAAAERFWGSLQPAIENRTAAPGPGWRQEGQHAHPSDHHPPDHHLPPGRHEEVKNSVHSSLGDGAQWYFRYRGSSYLLWTKASFLVAIECAWFPDAPDLGRELWRQVEELRDQVRLELEALFQPAPAPK